MKQISFNPSNLMLLKLGISQKNRDLTNSVIYHIEEQCDEMTHQLRHDVDWCSDPKAFYEKEIPFQLERIARRDIRMITAAITQGITQNMYWLKEQLGNMGVRNFSLPFQNYSLTANDFIPCKIELTNMHQGRLATRISMLFGAIIASHFEISAYMVSLLFSISGEKILSNRSLRSKERIKAIIPSIVDNYRDQMKIHILQVMSTIESQIYQSLNNIQYEPLQLR